MKWYKIYLLALCIICFASADAQTWTSKHIQYNKDSTLRYIPDAQGNTIPDFSLVGYAQGNAFPRVPVVKTIEPAGDSSLQVIQSAIDEVSAMPLNQNGFRGAIQLKKGIYKIPGTLKISAGGIVLQGEGYRQTKLIATGKGQRSLLEVKGTGNIKEIKGTRKKITESYVPVGRKYFTVSVAAGLRPGDSIIVYRPGTQKWITDLEMNQIEVRDSTTKQWTPAEYDLYFERIITRIDGDKIYIDNPIVMPIEDQYGGGEIYKYTFNGRISNVGIRNIVFESEYAGATDEDHGWNAIHVNRVENGWIDDITAVYFGYSCVNLGDKTRNITVHNCRSYDAKSKIEGGRRYSFNNDGQLNLIMNCRSSDGRHDFVTGAKVGGPNVFYNCTAEKTHADIGPHHRWAMGTLYDNIITDGALNAQDRGNWGTGHGWSGVTQVFWNCSAKEAAIQDPWVSGKNYVIGMKAEKKPGRLPGRNETAWEATDEKKLQPASLYEAQVKDKKKKK